MQKQQSQQRSRPYGTFGADGATSALDDNRHVEMVRHAAAAVNDADTEPLLAPASASRPLPPPLWRRALAEAIGTLILVYCGTAADIQATVSRGGAGDYLSNTLGWALGTMIGVYATVNVSGGHLNPAVTVALAVFRRFPWREAVAYILAQLAGGFVAAAVVYGVYHDALDSFDGGHRQIFGVNGTAGCFATYPKDFLSVGGGFADQAAGTALLLFGVFALSDARNAFAPPRGHFPASVALVVTCVGLAFGFNSGYAINPARDLGPRLWTALVYGRAVFTADRAWAWIPVTAPFVGGILGAGLYQAGLAPAQAP